MVNIKKSFAILPFFVIFFVFVSSNVLAAYENVYDEANLLTEEVRAELNNKAMTLSDQTQLEIVIVTIDDSQGKESSQYALDFYDEHGFGYESTLDGVLYLLNMDEREVYIFTRDKGTDYINASRVEALLDQVYPSLGDENYSESIDIFLNEVEKIMEAGPPAEQNGTQSGSSGYQSNGDSGYVNTDDGSVKGEASWLQKIGIYVLISFTIGGIAIAIMAMGNRGRSTVNASTYLQGNSFTVTRKQDRHYNTIVTQQKIQKNNNSSGGSFTGGSGGGGGIGGGGRKF